MVQHLIAKIKGSLRRSIVSLIKILFQYSEMLCVRKSNGFIKELDRRNKMRTIDGNHWFLPEEAILFEVIATIIVPTEEDTPGVNEMDVLGDSVIRAVEKTILGNKEKQKLYSEGLVVVDELAERLYKSKFIEISKLEQIEILNYLDISKRNNSNENTPLSKIRKQIGNIHRMLDGTYPAVKLFPKLVQDVKEAFYTSEVAWIWLEYDGPPMPNGYPDVHIPRSRKGAPGNDMLRDLFESGYGISGSNITPKKCATDVVVVGSGAGGGVVVKELAEAGLSVVVIEAGKRFNPYTDYFTDKADFEIRAGDVFEPCDERRDLYTVTGPKWLIYNRAKGVGGSTLKYLACKPRFHESDFFVRTEDGCGEDWPIRYADLEPFYTRVEYELGVSGPTGPEANPFEPPRSKPYPTPPHKFNLASLTIKRGADKLGLHMVREPLGLPTAEWNERPACINAGTCTLGCAIAAKSSMDVTYLRKAEKTGRVEIRSQCMAHRVSVKPDGKASGVVYFDREGREHEIHARAIVLAGNAVETPRLLLMSESNRFPDGLANSSGLVGKYFTEHLAVFAYGLFPDRMDPWRGAPTGGFLQDYYATNKANAFVRGWTTYINCGQHWPLSVANQASGWGYEHKRRMKEYFSHYVGLSSVGEQLPDERNQVTLDPKVKDLYGLPVPRLTNELGKNDLRMINAIRGRFKELLEAAGATEILENQHLPGGSSHYLGTCRMGLNPETSVVDKWGRTHDVPNLFIADGSVFVTGAAVNPSLTISALADRTAAGMIKLFQHGEL